MLAALHTARGQVMGRGPVVVTCFSLSFLGAGARRLFRWGFRHGKVSAKNLSASLEPRKVGNTTKWKLHERISTHQPTRPRYYAHARKLTGNEYISGNRVLPGRHGRMDDLIHTPIIFPRIIFHNDDWDIHNATERQTNLRSQTVVYRRRPHFLWVPHSRLVDWWDTHIPGQCGWETQCRSLLWTSALLEMSRWGLPLLFW